jgi:hypothetical protein
VLHEQEEHRLVHLPAHRHRYEDHLGCIAKMRPHMGGHAGRACARTAYTQATPTRT